MNIVRKTARDMVPKAIKLYIIDELKDYIHTELAPSLFDPSVNLVSCIVCKETKKNYPGLIGLFRNLGRPIRNGCRTSREAHQKAENVGCIPKCLQCNSYVFLENSFKC